MAIIQISEISNWSTNRWIYKNLLENVLSRLSEKDSLYEKIEYSLHDGSYFLDLSKCSYKDKHIFLSYVSNVLNQVKRDGITSFVSQEYYESFINKLNELIQLLDND